MITHIIQGLVAALIVLPISVGALFLGGIFYNKDSERAGLMVPFFGAVVPWGLWFWWVFG